MPQFESIILNAYWFAEGEFWNLSATGYNGENNPENVELSPSWLSKDQSEDQVKEELEDIGNEFVHQDPLGASADLVSLQFEGSEFKCLKRTPDTKV